jgi:deoxyribodipyrimidine photolyase-related protein
MSDFSEGEWCRIWDGLYWRFIHNHRDFFKKNPRMKVMINQIDRMGQKRMKEHVAIAEDFLENL